MNRKRLGIPIIGGRKWMGGIAYTELLLKALQTLAPERRPDCLLVADENNLQDIDLYDSLLPFFSCCLFRIAEVMGESRRTEVAARISLPVKFVRSEDELFAELDVYFPAIFASFPGRRAISWIPDFQHCQWPEFFPAAERQARDADTLAVLSQASMLVFSSQSVQADFYRFFSEQSIPTAVLPFYSYPEEAWYIGNPLETAEKYGLPEKFFLCCNQFWLHKNHKILGDALVWAKEHRGLRVGLVCTGSVSDYRTPVYGEQLTEYWRSLGVADQIHVLGMISRSDQLQLIRRSLAVVQPSLAEGWSTVVEDARAFGKKLLLSDIPVHQEQRPQGAEFFLPWDAPELGRLLCKYWQQASVGPDLAAEACARNELEGLVQDFAGRFAALLDRIGALESAQRSEPRVEYGAPPPERDIPSQLNAWGQDLLERFWPLCRLLAELMPASEPVTVWRGGIGALALALQSFGYSVTACGHSDTEDQMLQMLGRQGVVAIPELPEHVELAVLRDSVDDWDALLERQPRRVLLSCPAPEKNAWLQRLSDAGYTHQAEKTLGSWSFLAGAQRPWTNQQEASPLHLPAAWQTSQAYAAMKRERDEQAGAVKKLQAAYAVSESDRSARGEALKQMEGWLRDSESDRQARWETIQKLEQSMIPELHKEIERLQEANRQVAFCLERLNGHIVVRIGKKLKMIEKTYE